MPPVCEPFAKIIDEKYFQDTTFNSNFVVCLVAQSWIKF